MPLKPGFTECMNANSRIERYENLRKKYAIRPTEGYNAGPKCFLEVSKSLEEKKYQYETSVYEVLQGILRRVERFAWEDIDIVSHIIIQKGDKPVLIIENTRIDAKPDSICLWIGMSQLLENHWISEEDQQRQLKEAARWRVLQGAGVYVILCGVLTWLGDHLKN